jgi:hypothetical protein
MKESEFIELLNLYVDHEIGAEDAKRLEAEVAANPARRDVYRQYCRIQKACTLLADQFQEPALETDALPGRSGAWKWMTIVPAAGIAIAACVAVVLAVRSHISAPDAAGRAASQFAVQEHATRQADLPAIASDNYSRGLVPVLYVRDFGLNTGTPAPEGLAMAASQRQNDPLAWITRLQMQSVQPVPAAQADFKPNAELLSPDVRSNRPVSEQQEPIDLVAFRFQK